MHEIHVLTDAQRGTAKFKDFFLEFDHTTVIEDDLMLWESVLRIIAKKLLNENGVGPFVVEGNDLCGECRYI